MAVVDIELGGAFWERCLYVSQATRNGEGQVKTRAPYKYMTCERF